MSAPAISDLKRKYPDRPIHLLIDASFHHVKSIISDVDRVILFRRKLYQKMMGEAQFAMFGASDLLEKDLREVLEQEYFHVYNFSHNKISADIIAKVRSEEKFGIIGEEDNYVVSGSSFRKLNQSSEALNQTDLHYVDYLRLAVGGERVPLDKCLRFESTERVDSYIDNAEHGYVVVQHGTSDIKKTIPKDSLAKSIKLFRSLNKNVRVAFVCAPSENEEMQSFVNEFLSDLGGIDVLDYNLNDAAYLLSRAKVLLTVDTSIKHIASMVGCPILDIGLGGAKNAFTGAYSSKALSVTPKVDCYPCAHSSQCPHSERLCATEVEGEFIGLLLFKFLDQPSDIGVLAEEYSDKVELRRSFVTRFGYYSCVLDADNSKVDLEESLQKWMNWLSHYDSKDLEARTGSLAIEFFNLLVSMYGRQHLDIIKDQINDIMAKYITLLSDLQANLGGTDYSKLYFDKKRIERQIRFLQAFTKELSWSSDESFEGNSLDHQNIQVIRSLQNTTQSVKSRLEFGLKVLRNLQTSILESKYEIIRK